jgi:hypothetical protein
MRYSAGQADHTPRRPPQVAPRDTPRHRELTAVLAVAAVLVHLLLAQLTLVLAAVMYAVDRVGRWRPQWLAAPAGLGLLWALAIGPSRAGHGLAAGPRQVLSYLGAIGRYPGHLLRPLGAYAGPGHWLPEQFPLALILAAAEVLALSWARRRRDEAPAWRTGLVVATRRLAATSWLRSGGVVTRDGCCVGVDVATGRRAEISWQEAEGGVLCAGPGSGGRVTAATSDLADSAFLLAHAAIRRRKPVIIIDLAGWPALAEALAAACLAPGAPFACFSAAGPGYYEPLRGGDPARAANLVMAMIDWTDVGDQQRRSASAYLTDALAARAAAPGDRRTPVLDDLARLMTPDGLRERVARIPLYHPRRQVLTDRAAVSASLLQSDPATLTAPATQLPRLRGSQLGRWLEPGPPEAVRISLGRTVRERGVTLLSLDRHDHRQDARMIAGLAVADLTAVCGELQGMSVPADTLAWINGCELLEQRVLAELIAQGQGAGMGVVLSTASAAAADRLAGDVNVLVARAPVDAALAGKFTSRHPGVPGLDPDAGVALPTMTPGLNAVALLAGRPQARVVPWCRPVAAQILRASHVPAAPPATAGAAADAQSEPAGVGPG